ncbi:protein jag [Silvanigrella aquatica]|uniref:R3H domain-containing protein n=1 Tax=Silvanigrella aquatica TaxID=1915309 RepID=A0A1L4D182_9BACT|nr:R3H domain-containing nucleic acid-binding protein [Silvanigrella aquatica]APJ03959.1 hypothetical protein AXG55_08585 [Silvanigrella aquatica]
MDKRQFTGKTLEEAVSEAARAFATDKDLLCYNVIQQSQGGLFSRLFSRSVKIEAWVETVKEDLQAAAREVVRQTLGKKTVSKSNLSPLSQTLKKDYKESTPRKENLIHNKKDDQHSTLYPRKHVLPSEGHVSRTVLTMQSEGVQELFENYNKLFFSAFDVTLENVNIVKQENEVVVRIADEGIENYLSKSDKLSLAYEHVFKRIAQKKLGDISTRISIDAGESAEKREERLIGMARSLAEKVKKTGKSVILSSKSSQERRVIHLALDGFVGVATRSVGTGDKRRLVIYSTEKRNSSRQNQNSSHPAQSPKEKGNLNGKNLGASSKFKKKVHKKRMPHNAAAKQNSERKGAVSSSHNVDEEDLKATGTKKRSSSLAKED